MMVNMRLAIVFLVLVAAAVVAVVEAQEIMEAKTIVTFQRGFGDNGAAHGHHRMSTQDVKDTVHSMRRVVVPVGYEGSVSFLQSQAKLGEEEEEEEEEEHPRNLQGTDSPYPAPVRDGRSFDSAIAHGEAANQQADNVEFQAGNFHMNVIKDLHRRNLIRSVKYGVSLVPPWTKDYPVERRPDEVHHHVVSFPEGAFSSRPVVLITVMPVCDGSDKCSAGWTDTFAVSLAHVSLTDFSVNVLRMDSIPNNTWLQKIYIGWVAFEPNDVRKGDSSGDPTLTLHVSDDQD